VKATGVGGELRFKYRIAATLGRWSLETIPPANSQRYILSMSIASRIYPWSERTPLDIYLTMGNRRWQWCTVQFTVQGQDAVEVEVRGAPVIHAQGAANE
jgi:hypothetical protein|tara:strand:+ start:1461 stop:1760 length:300 start_codon:yes stop_codon:yes gene_type:complete